MKEFISSCAVIIVVVLIVEIFCPAKVMKKSLYMAFSLISLVVIVGGIKGLFKNSQGEGSSLSQLSVRLDTSSESILSTSAKMIEEQITTTLKNEGVNVDDISLDYYINELSMVIERVEVEIENKSDMTKTLKIVSEITGLSEGEIEIWVNS